MTRQRAFALGLIGTVTSAALILILAIVVFGPATHANLGEPDPGFDRVPTSRFDADGPFATPLTDEQQARLDSGTLPAEEAGRLTFFANGCGTCHGTAGQGTVVGPALRGKVDEEEIFEALRRGETGMPVYPTAQLSDEDAQDILSFLESALPADSATADEQ